MNKLWQGRFRPTATETVAKSVDMYTCVQTVIIWRRAGFNQKSHRSENLAILPYLVPSPLPFWDDSDMPASCNRWPAVSPNQEVEIYVAVDSESTNQMLSDFNLFCFVCACAGPQPSFCDDLDKCTLIWSHRERNCEVKNATLWGGLFSFNRCCSTDTHRHYYGNDAKGKTFPGNHCGTNTSLTHKKRARKKLDNKGDFNTCFEGGICVFWRPGSLSLSIYKIGQVWRMTGMLSKKIAGMISSDIISLKSCANSDPKFQFRHCGDDVGRFVQS